MLLDLFPLQLLILFVYSVCFAFWSLYDEGIFFLVQSIWCFVSFLYFHKNILLQVGKVFLYDFVFLCLWTELLSPLFLGLVLSWCPRFPEYFMLRNFWTYHFLWQTNLFPLLYLQLLRFSLSCLVFCWLCLHI